MKKWIIIILILLVGAAIFIVPMLGGEDEPCEQATFTFDDNLATSINKKIKVEVEANCENIARVDFYCNEELIQTWDAPKGVVTSDAFNPGISGLGAKQLRLTTTFENGETISDRRMLRVLSDITPKKFYAQIEKAYPHKTTSFTQGLEFYNGRLFEGTGDPGNQGATVIAEVDMTNGEFVRKMGLGQPYFGEGITVFNGKLFQITWMNNKCFVYDIEDFSRIEKEFTYTGEGWGLCNDGKYLYMSDGTERITVRDPENFGIKKTLQVYDNNGPIVYLNELEFIDGYIYANVWMGNFIMVIDPETGKVVQKIDATEVVMQGRGNGEVLNGIAYNHETDKLYLTGKNWANLYEVKLVD